MKTTIDEITESNTSLIEENAQLLREHAQRLITGINRALADRRAVEAANANDAEILAGKQREIDRLDAAVDPNDLDALQNLVARRDQLARLTKKYADEAKERLATADANILALGLTGEIDALITEGRLAALQKLTLVLRPYFSNDYLTGQCVQRTETMSKISRFQNFTSAHVATPTEIEDAVRELLQPVADGNPPWFFDRQTVQ